MTPMMSVCTPSCAMDRPQGWALVLPSLWGLDLVESTSLEPSTTSSSSWLKCLSMSMILAWSSLKKKHYLPGCLLIRGGTAQQIREQFGVGELSEAEEPKPRAGLEGLRFWAAVHEA